MFTFAFAPCPHIFIAIPLRVSFLLRLLHVQHCVRMSMMSELGNGGACVAIAQCGGACARKYVIFAIAHLSVLAILYIRGRFIGVSRQAE